MNEERLKKLYESAASVFDMPSYDQFVLDMQDDSKLDQFRNSMAEYYDIPEVDQLKSDLGIVKKKEDTDLPSEDGSLDSQDSYGQYLLDQFTLGSTKLGEALSSPLETTYRIGSIPQNLLAYVLDKPELKRSPEKLSEFLGIKNKILEFYEQESERLSEKVELYSLENYEKQGLIESFKAGNYKEGFSQLTAGLVGSAPFSLSLMVGGAATTYPRLFMGSTPLLMGPEIKDQDEKGKGELEAIANAFTISAAETAFGAIGSGTIGKVYRDILLREGVDQGKEVFRRGLIEVYEGALKKYGMAAGAAGEGVEEVATQITQNMANGLPPFQNVGDAFIQGFAGGGVYTSPITAMNARNYVQSTIAETKVNKIIDGTDYSDVIDVIKDVQNIDDATVEVSKTKNVDKLLGRKLKSKVDSGEITKEEAEKLSDNFNKTKWAVGKTDLLENVSDDSKKKIASLLIEKSDLKRKIETIDDTFLSKSDINKLNEINKKLETLESGGTIEAQAEPTVTPTAEPTVTEPAPQTVAQALNRPATLTSLGGSVLETPIEGDLYVEGQQVVIEDEAGNITEIGNVDEISDSTLQEIGIEVAEPAVKPMTDGNLMFEDRVLLSDKKGIKRNKRGEISRVTLREQDGAFVTLRGANAEEAAYQILLREATSPEQAEFINQQLEQNDEFRKATETTQERPAADTGQPAAGNRLFNEPLPDATTISDRFAERKGLDRGPVESTGRLDRKKSSLISRLFDKLKPDPNNPKVKRAYSALAEETLEQYQELLDAGYAIEINNNEPYETSADMIGDLRDNKRMKIFSTESGFGSDQITDQQRADNPLLRDSGFKDVNGQTLLVNDVFRAVHDFFGHAKLGNSFGPKGEEIAWRVHSKMFSPDARRAMTTETRGQNSWVNFSGVNDAAFVKRDEARALREQAEAETDVATKRRLLEEAKKKVDEAYAEMRFAEQKVALLPDDLVFEEEQVSDVNKEADDFLASVGQKPLFQKEQAETDQAEIDLITEEMNELSDERAAFDVPSDLTTKNKINIGSLTERFGEKVKTIEDISEYNGIPFMFAISDQLTTGAKENQFTGNTIELDGGIGFTMNNDTSAWSNVDRATSEQTQAIAQELYSNHKELFDRLWAEGKLPNGHVPMAIVKMGQNSIESNEAVFRVVSDNLKSRFTSEERAQAQSALLQGLKDAEENIQSKLDRATDKDTIKRLQAQLNANKRVQEFASSYDSLDQTLDNITDLPITSRKDIRNLVLYGSLSEKGTTKPGSYGKNPVLNVLLDGKEDSFRGMFHMPTINEFLKEEATKDIPKEHIISIVGVDVLNPRITSVANGDFQHKNYSFGTKGQLIGVLEKPVHAADVFPEMYSKSVYTFKENKSGAVPSPGKAVSQSVAAGGAVATIKAFRGAKISTKMSTLDIVLGKLKQAFPAVTVVSTQAEFDAAVNSPDVTKYSREGDIIYGFTKDGKVFLNPEIATTNTAIHEYGHVWMNFVEENNPALLQKGFDLLEGTETLKEKIRIHGDNKTARMEALADLIGNKGDAILNAAQKSKFKNWLNAMYTYIKKKFKAFSDMSADEFQDMSLKQFVEGVLSDLVSGREITDKVVRSVDTTFQKVNANDLIEKGIENGFSKQAIKLGLERIGADVSGFNDAYSAAKAKYDKNTGRPRQVEVDDIYDRSKKAIQDKVKKKNLKFYRDKTRELILDRQTRIKNLLNGIGSKEAQKAVNLLVTKAGASGYANFRFKEADQKIFKGLSVTDTETLDKIIYARRIDAINDNRKQRGLESYVGIEGYNQETAKRNLKEIKDDIGAEKFNDLNRRATEYFKVFNQNLDRMREASLISEEVYIQLKETDYSPIKTIKYLIPDDYDAAQIDRMAQITGMNRDLVKSLSDENVNEVIMDSRWLLMTNVSMVEARVSENRMLNAVYDAIDSATNEQVKGMEDYIKPNPVFDYTKTGKPRYKYDVIKVPQGFVKVGFFRDGNRLDLVVQETYARQLLDVKTDQKALRYASKWTAVNIIRFFATAANPVFIIPNSAIDFANILLLSDVYSKNKFSGGARLAFDAVSNFLSKVGGTKGYNKVYEEYMLHGGSMDYLASDGLRVLEDLTFKKSLDPAKKALASIARVLSYTGESSEIAFRLAVYNKSKENQIKDFKKTNKREPDAQEMEDIMFAAAREARETIDFAQGGSVVKGADKILPYFNAANQGFRKGLDYATENPLGFASSVIQGMIMSASLASLGMFLLLRAIGDDDEEEVKRVLNSVSDHEKANYHVVFTGRKNDEGEYEYYRIRKLPLTSAASTLAEQAVINAVMEYKGIDYNIDYSILLDNAKSAAPIVPTLKNILSRNPALSALITYHFNYDMFYDQEVFRGPRDKKIKPSAEGIYDNRVEMIYKDLSKALSQGGIEMSPKRAQAAVEKIITSETTNPTIGLIYSGYDGIRSVFSDGPGMNDELNTFIDRTVDNTSKKLVRYTNKDLIRYKQEADVEADRIEDDTEKYVAEQKIYSEINKRYREEKGEFTAGEFIDLIEENFDPDDYSKYKKKYLAYIKNLNADRAILDIIFEDSPEIQAKMLFNKYGDALEEEELDDLINASKAARRKLSKKGLYIYRQKYQNR